MDAPYIVAIVEFYLISASVLPVLLLPLKVFLMLVLVLVLLSLLDYFVEV